jgi:hypothetical protein
MRQNAVFDDLIPHGSSIQLVVTSIDEKNEFFTEHKLDSIGSFRDEADDESISLKPFGLRPFGQVAFGASKVAFEIVSFDCVRENMNS